MPIALVTMPAMAKPRRRRLGATWRSAGIDSASPTIAATSPSTADERHPGDDDGDDPAHHPGDGQPVAAAAASSAGGVTASADRRSAGRPSTTSAVHVAIVVVAVLEATRRVGIPPAHGADCRRTLVAVELVLIRHAQPEWVRDGLNVVDPPLTELGQRQAEALATAMAGQEFDEVLVSPLLRARQTAAPVLEALGRDRGHRHVAGGDPRPEVARHAGRAGRRGLPRAEQPAVGRALARASTAARTSASSSTASASAPRSSCQERGVHQVEGELPVWQIAEPGKRIALIAHAGTNSIVICHLLGLPPTPWEWERMVLRHASISRLEAIPLGDGYTFSLTALSDVEHLPATADRDVRLEAASR